MDCYPKNLPVLSKNKESTESTTDYVKKGSSECVAPAGDQSKYLAFMRRYAMQEGVFCQGSQGTIKMAIDKENN